MPLEPGARVRESNVSRAYPGPRHGSPAGVAGRADPPCVALHPAAGGPRRPEHEPARILATRPARRRQPQPMPGSYPSPSIRPAGAGRPRATAVEQTGPSRAARTPGLRFGWPRAGARIGGSGPKATPFLRGGGARDPNRRVAWRAPGVRGASRILQAMAPGGPTDRAILPIWQDSGARGLPARKAGSSGKAAGPGAGRDPEPGLRPRV